MAILSADGTKILNNYDRFTGKAFNASKVTTYADGSDMNDAKVDNAIYFKLPTSLGGGYAKRDIEDNRINVKWFGAKADFVATSNYTGSGTDDTTAIQKAVDYAVNTNGGVVYFPAGKYLISGTVYINVDPYRRVPISVVGDETGSRGNKGTRTGVLIHRGVAGDCFRVNLKSDGSVNLPPRSGAYDNFSITGINFLGIRASEGDTPVLGMRGFNIFRTRTMSRSISAEFFDYAIYQGDNDINGVEDYCDGSIFTLTRIISSTFGGIRVNFSDGSIIEGFYFEGPYLPTNKYAIEALNSSDLTIRGCIIYSPKQETPPTPVAASRLISLRNCINTDIGGIHIEYIYAEFGIDVVSCSSTRISGLHIRYLGNSGFRLINNQCVKIENWINWSNHLSGRYDIVYQGFNYDVSIEKSQFFNSPPDNTTQRSISTSAFANSITYGKKSRGTLDAQLTSYYLENVKKYEIDDNGNVMMQTLTIPKNSSTTNYNRFKAYWDGNNIVIGSEFGGSETQAGIKIPLENIGIGVDPSTDIKLDLIGSNAKQLRISNTIVDLANKLAYIIGRHYENSKRDVAGLIINSQETLTDVTIGGGSSSLNAATQVRVFVAANTDTATGTEIFFYNINGAILRLGTLRLPVGTSSLPPLIIPPGTATTVAVEGAFDNNGVDLYFTLAASRKRIAFKNPDPFTINASSSQQATVNRKFIADRATLLTITMPLEADAVIGDQVIIRGKGVGLWKLAQNASQIIHTPSGDTTTGVSGYIQATNRYDHLVVEKIATNEWTLIEGSITLTTI